MRFNIFRADVPIWFDTATNQFNVSAITQSIETHGWQTKSF